MKDVITHIKSQRAKRPREQHLRIDTRKVDELLKAVEDQQAEMFKLEDENRKLKKDAADSAVKLAEYVAKKRDAA